MKRYSAFDPPEYIDWQPDPQVMEAYRATVERDSARRQIIEDLPNYRLLDLYVGMLRFRLHDIALKRWVRQGVITKAWLGTGEEATTIGPVHALNRSGADGDVVGPMIRNAGACHEMGMPVADMLRGYLATADSPNAGRDLHIGGAELGIVAPTSMVGALAPVMAGYALAFRKRSEQRVALTWIGDGSTKSGAVHEAFALAAAQQVPVVYIIQNNQVALGTRLRQHHRAEDFSEWGRLYGAQTAAFDGNHVLDAYAATRWAVEECHQGNGPVFLSAETFRMGGHATHDESEARTLFEPKVFAEWGMRDPIGCYETWLEELPMNLKTGERVSGDAPSKVNRKVLADIETDVTDEVESAAERALASRAKMPKPKTATDGVYKEWPAEPDGRAPFTE